jgi:hypothetical protein
VVKIEPIESKIILKINLKNTDIWMCDFDDHLEMENERAQILQIEFMGDFFMESETFSRYITRSKFSPPKKVVLEQRKKLGSSLYGA